ncbi:MAG: hypothetical protein V3T83_22830 [Acidobacteriota bacterium]
MAGRILVRSDQPIAAQQLFGLTRPDGTVAALSCWGRSPLPFTQRGKPKQQSRPSWRSCRP